MTVETIEGTRGLVAKIRYDDCPCNPITEWDNLAETSLKCSSYRHPEYKHYGSLLRDCELDILFQYIDGFVACVAAGKVKPEFFDFDQAEINREGEYHPFIDEGIYDLARKLVNKVYDLKHYAVCGYVQGDYWEYIGIVTKDNWHEMQGDKPFYDRDESGKEIEWCRNSEFEAYLKGDTYLIEICDPEGETLDIIGGYYSIDEATDEANRLLEWHESELAKYDWKETEYHI